MYTKLKQKILPELIPPHARILVAVSGGPDSVALAHILWRYASEFIEKNISLVITHVHHGVRKESDDEEVMVKDLAREWGVPCRVHRFDSKAYAKETGQSFQTAAREWRYAKWKEDMIREKCTLLATAHHLGDQAETLLYRLLRGSGAAGLAGIYPQKDGVIRPLLTIGKQEVLQYCRSEQLPYAFDQSNAEPIYVRNKIRLELLPELEKHYNSRVQEALGRTAELLRWDEEYLSHVAEATWLNNALERSRGEVGLKHAVFQEPKAIFSRLIRRAAAMVTEEPRGIGFSYVEQIMDSKGQIGWSQDLPGLHISIDYEGIWFRNVKFLPKHHEMGQSISFTIPVRFGEWVQWRDFKGQTWEFGLFDRQEAISFLRDELTDREPERERVFFDPCLFEVKADCLVWRNRQPGDTMWFDGVGHKELKKVFQEEKVGKELRMNLPLLALGHEILWIPGVRRSDRYRVSSKKHVMGIMYSKEGMKNI